MAEACGQSNPALPFDAYALARHRDLVARIGNGDGEALQLLYLELGSLVNGVARRILENREDAREVVQDTFIKAWHRARDYRADRGEVVAWLVLIARHAAIDRVRRGARRRLLYEAFHREPHDDVDLPSAALGDREEVSRRLLALSEPQRRALELAFFGGCTQAQIAAAMQTPVGNVKNHLRRGLQRLRDLARQP